MNRLNKLQALPFQHGGKVIHCARDEYGGILVIDDGRQRILNFDSLFEQSCMQLAQPHQLVHLYTRFMLLAVAFVDPIHITLLGLGGGSLLRTLHHTLPQCHFHAVELRQAVVEVAEEYFALPSDHRVSITVNDAFEEISNIQSKSSDIIFSDMYDAYRMAPKQIQEKFLLECARVLRNQGFLVINLHNLPRDSCAFFQMLRGIFPTVMLCAAAENTVLFASMDHSGQVEPGARRIKEIEQQLAQRLEQLLARLQPLDPAMP